MSMESLGTPSFERQDVEPRVDIEINRETCQRRLLSQAAGRQIDNIADEFLIEQINASALQEEEGYALLGCLTAGCERQCTVKTEQGILRVVEDGIQGYCIETAVAIGQTATH